MTTTYANCEHDDFESAFLSPHLSAHSAASGSGDSSFTACTSSYTLSSTLHPPSFLRDEQEPNRSLYPHSVLAPQSFLSVSAAHAPSHLASSAFIQLPAFTDHNEKYGTLRAAHAAAAHSRQIDPLVQKESEGFVGSSFLCPDKDDGQHSDKNSFSSTQFGEDNVTSATKGLDVFSKLTVTANNLNYHSFDNSQSSHAADGAEHSGMDSEPVPSSNVGLQCPFSFAALRFPSVPAYMERFHTFSSVRCFSLIYTLLISMFRALCCDYSFNHHKCKFSCVYYDSNSCEALTFRVFFYQQQEHEQEQEQRGANEQLGGQKSTTADSRGCRTWIEFQRRFGSALTFQRMMCKLVQQLRDNGIVEDTHGNTLSAGAAAAQAQRETTRAQAQRMSELHAIRSQVRGNGRERHRSPRTAGERDRKASLSPLSAHSPVSSACSSPLSSRSHSPPSPRPSSPFNPGLQVEGRSVQLSSASGALPPLRSSTVPTSPGGCTKAAPFVPPPLHLSSPSTSLFSASSPRSVAAPSPTASLASLASSGSVTSVSSASISKSAASPTPFCPPLHLDDCTTEILLCMCDVSAFWDALSAVQALTALSCAAEDAVNAALLCSRKYAARVSGAVDMAIHSGDAQLLRLVCLLLARLSDCAAFVPSDLLSPALFDSVLSVLDCSCCIVSSSRAMSKPLKRSFIFECKRLCARMLRNCVVCPWRRRQFQQKIFGEQNQRGATTHDEQHASERRCALDKIIGRYEKNEDGVLREEMQRLKNSLQMRSV